jgi:predicted nucleotidyltransferase
MFKQDWLIYKVVSGSRAYGTNLETSDEDTKGICIPDLEYYLSYHKRFEQYETKNPDMVIYELRKFIKLAADCNPNIIEVLFADESDILYMDDLGKMLRDNRQMFLSAKAKHTFAGYAFQQAKRIKNHKAWHDKAPEKPKREDYDLPEGRSLMDHSQIINIDKEFGFNKDKPPSSDAREMVAQKHGEKIASAYFFEKRWRVAMRDYENYESWKATRNKERYATEVAFNYDVKMAYHLIRLSRMCKEILTTGKVYVKRPDAEEIKAIRRGEWSYEQVLEEAELLEKECNEIYQAKSYVVPHAPDVSRIDELCIEILKKRLMR